MSANMADLHQLRGGLLDMAVYWLKRWRKRKTHENSNVYTSVTMREYHVLLIK